MAAGIERGLLLARPMFDRIEADRVVWDDGTAARADAIIWATGFRPSCATSRRSGCARRPAA